MSETPVSPDTSLAPPPADAQARALPGWTESPILLEAGRRSRELEAWLIDPRSAEDIASRISFIILLFLIATTITVSGCTAIFMFSNVVRVAACLSAAAGGPCPFFVH